MHVCMYVCMCIYIYICIYTHIISYCYILTYHNATIVICSFKLSCGSSMICWLCET